MRRRRRPTTTVRQSLWRLLLVDRPSSRRNALYLDQGAAQAGRDVPARRRALDLRPAARAGRPHHVVTGLSTRLRELLAG
jgi:hypothetical protein